MEIKDIISSGLLELYAAGLASKEEALQVEQWVAQYPEVAVELASIGNSLEAYALMHAVQPDVSVKEKLFSKIQSAPAGKVVSMPVPPVAKIIPIASYWKWVAAASVIILMGSVAMNIIMVNRFMEAGKDLRKTQQMLASLQEKNKIAEENLLIVQNKYSKPVLLSGLDPAPEATAKIFWMQNTGEVYVDPGNLPQAPEGKQYQLWAIVDGVPVDAGMIDTAAIEGVTPIQKMKTFPKVEAFAVSLESEAGNTSPKGPVYVMGKV